MKQKRSEIKQPVSKEAQEKTANEGTSREIQELTPSAGRGDETQPLSSLIW